MADPPDPQDLAGLLDALGLPSHDIRLSITGPTVVPDAPTDAGPRTLTLPQVQAMLPSPTLPAPPPATAAPQPTGIRDLLEAAAPSLVRGDLQHLPQALVESWFTHGPKAVAQGVQDVLAAAAAAAPHGRVPWAAVAPAVNRTVSGAMTTAAPAALPAMAAAVPAAYAAAGLSGVGLLGAGAMGATALGGGAEHLATRLGASPDTAALVGNVAGLVDPVAPLGMLGAMALPGGARQLAAAARAAAETHAAETFLQDVFPKWDNYGKPRAFVQPDKIVPALTAAGAPADLLAKATTWVDALSSPVKPEEIQKVLSGQTFDRGRVLRAVTPLDPDATKRLGAPLGVTTARQEAALREKYIQNVTAGLVGKDWYRDSGAALRFAAGDQPDVANRLGAAMAVTSASNTVPSNVGMAVKGHNQFMAGEPVNTGRFPTEQSKAITDAYSGAAPDLGPKRQPFADQLARGGGYAQGDQRTRAVHDIWQGEAFGYVNPDGTPLRRGFSAPEHRWMDAQTEKILAELNKRAVGGHTDWDTGTAQAAAWTGAKLKAGLIKPEEAAKSYADFIERQALQLSRDHIPGVATGHLAGLQSAPYAVRQAYARGVEKILYDAQGRDASAAAKGLLTGASYEGPGVWADTEGLHMHPGRQVPVLVGSVEGPKAPGDKKAAYRVLDPASERLVRAHEAEYGLLTGQEAVAGSKLDYDAPKALRDAADVPLKEGTLRRDSPLLTTPAVLKGLASGHVVVIPTTGGVRLKNAGMAPAAFDALVKEVVTTHGNGLPRFGKEQGFYDPNEWGGEGRVGQQYARIIKAGTPALIDLFNKTAPGTARKLMAWDTQFAKRNGFPLDPRLMEVRQAVADHGFAGITKLALKYGLPVPVLLMALLGQSPDQSS